MHSRHVPSGRSVHSSKETDIPSSSAQMVQGLKSWVAVQELCYYTRIRNSYDFSIYPLYGNSKQVPQKQPRNKKYLAPRIVLTTVLNLYIEPRSPHHISTGTLMDGDSGAVTKHQQNRATKDHINRRISQTMMSGIPLLLGLGTRM